MRPQRSDQKTATDGVTKGWLLFYPNPDPQRSWEKIAATLVIARRGRVVRRIEGSSTFRGWTFLHGGSEVAYETGGLHGPTSCFLRELATGRMIASVEDCESLSGEAPGWVKALQR